MNYSCDLSLYLGHGNLTYLFLRGQHSESVSSGNYYITLFADDGFLMTTFFIILFDQKIMNLVFIFSLFSSFRFFHGLILTVSNSKAYASEFQENLEKMFCATCTVMSLTCKFFYHTHMCYSSHLGQL